MIRYVTPDGEGERYAEREGWRFLCPACRWRSPITSRYEDASRERKMHTCRKALACGHLHEGLGIYLGDAVWCGSCRRMVEFVDEAVTR